MSEKLIPFDFAEFTKEPMRLRRADGTKPRRASVVFGDSIAVSWTTDNRQTYAYMPHEFNLLHLAAKTRIVRVRLLQDHGDKRVWAYTSDFNDLDAPTHRNAEWIGEAFEREVTE